MIKNFAVVVATIATSLYCIGLSQAEPIDAAPVEQPDYAVDIITKNGAHVQMPYFDKNVRTISPELKETLTNNAHEMIGMISVRMRQSLVENENWMTSKARWAKFGATLLTTGIGQSSKIKKLSKDLTPLRVRVNQSVKEMFNDLVKKSEELAGPMSKEDGSKDLAKLNSDLQAYLDNLVETVESSPVGTYIDLADGSIDNEKFVDHTSKLMARLRINGFDRAFGALQTLLNHLASSTK